jgi:hypothetical protein
MHARIFWRRLRIVLSITLKFSFWQNETAVSFDQNENTAAFIENFKLFQWLKIFHSSLEDGLMNRRTSLFFVEHKKSHVFLN